MSEIEKILGSEKQQNPRPFGRFLLSRARYATYDYAASFAKEYKDIINPAWSASVVARQSIGGINAELEFADGLVDEGFYTWRLYADHQQYDIHANSEGYRYGTYYEFSSQGALKVRREIGSRAILDCLQSAIEFMTNTDEFHDSVSQIRTDWWKATVDSAVLEMKDTLSFKERNDLKSIKSQLFKAGFPVGSVDVRSKIPQINPRDWRPVVIDD